MSRNYKEDQANEIEALESIYYSEMEGLYMGLPESCKATDRHICFSFQYWRQNLVTNSV